MTSKQEGNLPLISFPITAVITLVVMKSGPARTDQNASGMRGPFDQKVGMRQARTGRDIQGGRRRPQAACPAIKPFGGVARPGRAYKGRGHGGPA
jgi:hypothetical protein